MCSYIILTLYLHCTLQKNLHMPVWKKQCALLEVKKQKVPLSEIKIRDKSVEIHISGEFLVLICVKE